jgi:hypothetical protein
MIIRAYAHMPRTYVADAGEVVHARRSASDPFAQAVIMNASRRHDGSVRYTFMWLETMPGTSAVEGQTGNVYVRKNRPQLIRQIDRDRPADVSAAGSEPSQPGSGSAS